MTRYLTRRTAAVLAAAIQDAVAGSNLLRNASAQAGAVSKRGWDAVTIPGWQVASGLPTVVRYGTPGFPPAADAGSGGSGQRLFAGGAGGTAELTQQVPLRPVAGGALPAGTRFRLAGWFGGTATSRASLTVIFRSAAGRQLGEETTGPVGGSGTTRRFDWAFKKVTGLVPAGTRSATAELTLRTSRTNDDGPNAPLAGYDRAVAAGLRLSVSAAVRRRALVPPVARVPRYRHVFLFYFENEDFGQIVGNTAQAPYLNGLLPRSSLLAGFYAEEHPSDGNYLALAGGSTFGIPLDDPAEENPLFTINARNISDLVDGAHESWKAYLQSANGPCDDTVHENYWDDDQPMMYFADVRERPAYCAQHVVPLQELAGDLRHASTTPNFAWVSPDDCSDMEGCGIAAGDAFARQELGADPDAIALTPGGRTALVVNYGSDTVTPIDTATGRARAAIPAGQAPDSIAITADGRTAYVADGDADAVTPIATGTGRAGAPIRVGYSPASVTVSPSGGAAYVVNTISGTVTPVAAATGAAGTAIPVGQYDYPLAMAFAPDGSTALVLDTYAGQVTPVNPATGQAAAPITVGNYPVAAVITS